jgi:four helix bundle protein
MGEVRRYQDLLVWQKSMDFIVECYRVSRSFPSEEKFGLTSQLQRAVVSVPANIAEGQGRQHTTEFIQFLCVSYGSLMEVETHLQIACRLGYLPDTSLNELLKRFAEIGRLLNGLLRSLRQKTS